jgi:hypothetical protein
MTGNQEEQSAEMWHASRQFGTVGKNPPNVDSLRWPQSTLNLFSEMQFAKTGAN